MEDVPYGPGDSPGGLLRCLLRPNAPPHPEGQEPGHRSINDTYFNQTLIDPQVKDAGRRVYLAQVLGDVALPTAQIQSQWEGSGERQKAN